MDMDSKRVGNAFNGDITPTRRRTHYHGDEVRVLFFVSALILVIAESTGANLPFSTLGAVFTAVLLVVVAGITNPAQFWIHWINATLAILGVFIFGTDAINHYRAGLSLFDPSFLYVEGLSLLSLIALYFTTRTIRGIIQRPTLS